MALQVDLPGALTTVQDLGRTGFERFGVPVSGAMDTWALRAANALVGNPPAAAALELGFDGLTASPTVDVALALTGAGPLAVRVNGRPMPVWTTLFVRARQTVEVSKLPSQWAYLAVRGGIDVPLVLGSRATYLRGGFGGWLGRALQPGDLLPLGPPPDPRPPAALAGRLLAEANRPPYAEALTVEVVLGPQLGAFSQAALAAFLTATFTVTTEADRMGYRLAGPALTPARGDLLSEGMALGAIQVPAGGQPIVMLADRPTTGGYPKIATVTRADVPLLAQCPPGQGQLRFRATSVAAAHGRYQDRLARLSRIEEVE